MAIVYFVLILSIICIVHELGHLFTAKMFHVYCYEFSIGMGPKLFGKKWKETEYNVRALPLGGYVRMAGDDDDEQEESVPEERRLYNIKAWKRVIVMLAGIFNNILTCILFLSLVYLLAGNIIQYPEPIIKEVTANTPAERAGMRAEDEIISITFSDGYKLTPDTFADVKNYLSIYHDKATYHIRRGDSYLDLKIEPEYSEENQAYVIGVMMHDLIVKEVTVFNCLGVGVSETIGFSRQMVDTIINMLKGHGLENLSGPIGIYNTTSETMNQAQSLKETLIYFFYLIAVLSLNVGLFNLIPLPIMDGGRVLLLTPELITGKPVSEKVQNALIVGSMGLLLLLFVYVMFNDVTKFIF